MKLHIKLHIKLLISVLLPYLVVSFYYLSINPVDWSSFIRGMLILFIAFVYSVINLIEVHNKS